MSNSSAGYELETKSVESMKQFGMDFRKALDTVAEEYMYSPKVRQINAASYLCMAKCHNNDSTRGEIRACVSACSGSVIEMQKHIQNEMNAFHSHLRQNLESCAKKLNDDGVPAGM